MQVANHLLLSSLIYDNDLEPFTPAINMPASVERALTYGYAAHHDLGTLARLQRTAVKEIARAVDRESFKTRSKTHNVVYSSDHAKTKLEGYRQHLYQLANPGLDPVPPTSDVLRETRSVALLTVASSTLLVASAAATAVAVAHTVKNLWSTPSKPVGKVWKRGSATRKTFRALNFFSVAHQHVLRKNSSTQEIAFKASETIDTTLQYIAATGPRVANKRWQERLHEVQSWNTGGGGGGGGGCGGGGCGGCGG